VPASPPVVEPPLEPLTNNVVPPTVLATIAPLLADAEEPLPVATEYAYLPLVWLNLLFDVVVGKLPGGVLWQSAVGRMLLAFMGIVLTLAAGSWLWKDWLGWTY
jgi:hypothetical protein